MNDDAWRMSAEIGEEVADSFSELHPDVRMSRNEWADLIEMIQREVYGRISGEDPQIYASDLLRHAEKRR